jgi:deoxycytidylate deaminase
MYVSRVHAEANALLNKNSASVEGAVSGWCLSQSGGGAAAWATCMPTQEPGTLALCQSGACFLLPCAQTVYVTMFPCNECAKLLIQAGIREVVYHEVSEGGEKPGRCALPTPGSAGAAAVWQPQHCQVADMMGH